MEQQMKKNANGGANGGNNNKPPGTVPGSASLPIIPKGSGSGASGAPGGQKGFIVSIAPSLFNNFNTFQNALLDALPKPIPIVYADSRGWAGDHAGHARAVWNLVAEVKVLVVISAHTELLQALKGTYQATIHCVHNQPHIKVKELDTKQKADLNAEFDGSVQRLKDWGLDKSKEYGVLKKDWKVRWRNDLSKNLKDSHYKGIYVAAAKHDDVLVFTAETLAAAIKSQI